MNETEGPVAKNDEGNDVEAESLARRQVLHGFLLLILMALPAVLPPLAGWPAKVLVPVGAYALIVALFPPLRASVLWLQAGKMDRTTVLYAAALVLASTSVLLGWYAIVHPDLHAFQARFPSVILTTSLAIGLLFATLNATVEEMIWRGVLMDALTARLGRNAALVVQAISFGAGHYAGIPGGTVGVVLATGYGFALGLLRRRAGGLLACILAHVGADAVIYGLILHSH